MTYSSGMIGVPLFQFIENCVTPWVDVLRMSMLLFIDNVRQQNICDDVREEFGLPWHTEVILV